MLLTIVLELRKSVVLAIPKITTMLSHSDVDVCMKGAHALWRFSYQGNMSNISG